MGNFLLSSALIQDQVGHVKSRYQANGFAPLALSAFPRGNFQLQWNGSNPATTVWAVLNKNQLRSKRFIEYAQNDSDH